MALFLCPSPHALMTSTKTPLPLPNFCCLSYCDRRNINHKKRKSDNVAILFGRRYGIENPIEELGFEPAECKFSHLHTYGDQSGGPTRFLHNEYRVYFPGVKRPGSGVDHLPYREPRFKI